MRMLVTGTEAIPKLAWTMTLFRRTSRQVCGICAAVLILVLSNQLLGYFSGFQFALTQVYDDINVDITPSDNLLTPDRQTRPRVPGRHVYLPPPSQSGCPSSNIRAYGAGRKRLEQKVGTGEHNARTGYEGIQTQIPPIPAQRF